MNVYIFSFPINIFKMLLKAIHNIESVLSSPIFLSHKTDIFNLFDLPASEVKASELLSERASKQESYVALRRQRKQPIFLPT